MSDSAPTPRFGRDAPEGDAGERHVVVRTLLRLRSFIVLVPLVVGVLVAASIGASKLWADIPQKTVAGPNVVCWDGRTIPVTDCVEPRGKRGLHWVFPSYKPWDKRCALVGGRSRTVVRPFDVACNVRFDQRPVTVTYAVRGSAEALVAAVRKSYGNRPVTEADGDRIVFRSNRPDAEGLYRTTITYAEHPFAVTVEAPDQRLRDTALDELVRFRPADQIIVRKPA